MGKNSHTASTARMMAMRSSVTGLTVGPPPLFAQSAGLSHRSAFSNVMKNRTLTRITKQIAA